MKILTNSGRVMFKYGVLGKENTVGMTLPLSPSNSWTNDMYSNYTENYDGENTTILLGEFTGVDESTSFIDKTGINTLTAYGQAQLDTDQISPFGDYTGVLKLIGNDASAVRIADNDNWNVNSTDTVLSVETWIKFDADAPTLQGIFSAGETGGSTGSTRVWCFRLREDTGRKLELTYCNNDSWTTISSSVISTPLADEWHHYAMTINNGTVTFYFDGVQIGSETFSLNIFPEYGATIGGISYNVPAWQNPCAFSEVRIVKGTLPWTETFSVPTSRYLYIKKSLKAYWSFDKNLLTDDSGNGHALTNVGGVTRVSGKNNYGASFNGTDQYLSAEDSNDYDLSTNDFTIAFWCYAKTTGNNYPTLIANKSTGSWTTGCFAIRYDNTGLSSKFSIHWNSEGDPLISSSVFAANNWYFIVVKRINNLLTLSVNSTIEDSQTVTSSLDLSFGGNLVIGGGNWDGANGYTPSLMDEIMILKGQGLSQEEIIELYKSGDGRFYRRKFGVIN